MNVTLEKKAVVTKINEILIDVLGLDDGQVIQKEQHLINDLGAESIDMVDIVYSVEKEFGLKKLEIQDIYPVYLMNEAFNIEEIRAKLRKEYPFIGEDLVDTINGSEDIKKLFTVETLYKFAELQNECL